MSEKTTVTGAPNPKFRIHVQFDSSDWDDRKLRECGCFAEVGVNIYCGSNEELLEQLECVTALGHQAEVIYLEE